MSAALFDQRQFTSDQLHRRPGVRMGANWRGGGHRRGMTLMEITIALGMLGAAFGILLPLLQSVSRTQLGVERERLAQVEAANLLERLAQCSYDKLTPESVKNLQLSDAARRELPQAVVVAEVVDQPGELPARRVSVEVKWQPAAGQKSPVCRLVTWVYAPQEAKP